MNELMQQTLTGLLPHGRRLARKEEVQGLSPRTRTKETASQSWGFFFGDPQLLCFIHG